MVFQGTVLGPPLWNCYYADAATAVRARDFVECIFADDLNCWRVFGGCVGNRFISEELRKCQTSLHEWGFANQVVFEASKESHHILDKVAPSGRNFKLLGVTFDPKLAMVDAVQSLSFDAGWRLRTLLRVHRYYDVAAMVRLFKCHILSFLEGTTAAIYHAAPSVLKPLDDLFTHFLSHLGISKEQALLKHNLAPLCMRRDLAMLGLLHKVSLGVAPEPVSKLFVRSPKDLYSHGFRCSRPRHKHVLHDPIAFDHPAFMKRSIFGLVKVYNSLRPDIVNDSSVSSLQRKLQAAAKQAATAGGANWPTMFNRDGQSS